MTPLVSIIIPTYNGAHRIGATLASLATQTRTDFEVIVVIDGSTDNTAEVVSAADPSLTLFVIEQANAGRAGARNAGVGLARATKLVFLDDDVVVPISTIEKYIVRAREGHLVVAGAFYPVYSCESEFSRYLSYLNDRWSDSLPKNGGNLTRPYLSAGNFLIEKNVFMQIGGFSGVLSDAEDRDLAIRLFEAGNSIYFDPLISVGHTIQQSFREYAARQLQYHRASKALWLHNPLASKYLAPIDLRHTVLKLVIYRALSSPLFLRLMDKGFFRRFPRRIRFKAYDVLLTAFVLNNDKV